jgi:DNA-directed RNA polymerase specialized sigma24 family protein
MSEERATDCRPERELAELTDEQLLAYIEGQREAGHDECAKQAFAILAFGHWDRVKAWVAAKVPPEHVEDVAGLVIEGALKAAFKGKTVGEFVNFLKVITSRRIADHTDAAARRIDADPLADEHEGDEEIFGARPAVESHDGAIAIRECVGRALEPLSEVHRAVIHCYGPGELGFEGLDARETTERVERLHPGAEISEANVHKIWSRFRVSVADELGMGS